MTAVNQNKEFKMKQRKVQISYVGDASEYGFKSGDWVNSKVFFAVLKEMKKDKLVIPTWYAQAQFEDDKMVARKDVFSNHWEEVA